VFGTAFRLQVLPGALLFSPFLNLMIIKMKNKSANQNDRRLVFLFLVVILTLTFISFLPSLKSGFIRGDDYTHLLNNNMVRSLAFHNILHIFKSTINDTYIPLTILTFVVEYHFFQFNPAVYHLVNLLLHLGIVSIIFFLAFKMGLTLWAASLAALLFGIHPMHVESVAWITQRKDVLYGLFYMLAVYQYWRYLENKKIIIYILTLGFGLLSMLAKPMALSLPLIFLLFDWIYMKELKWSDVYEKIPHFFYIVPIAWITFSRNASAYAIHENLGKAVLTFVWTLIFYIQRFIFPYKLQFDYYLPQPISIYNIQYYLAVVCFLLIIFFAIRNRRNHWFLFAISYYFLSIFFLLRFGFGSKFDIVADRFMYLPSLGFCLLFGVFCAKRMNWLQMRNRFFYRLFLICLVLIFFILSNKTFRQCKIWNNSISFYSHIIRYVPTAKAYTNRGVALFDLNSYDLALVDFNNAIKINPDSFAAYNNRGLIYMKKDQNQFAFDDFQKAIEINLECASCYNNKGTLYKKIGQLDKSIVNFTKAIEYDQKFAAAYENRGNTYFKMGLYDLANLDFDKVIEFDQQRNVIFLKKMYLFNEKKEYQKSLEYALKARSQGIKINEQYLEKLRVLANNEKN